MSTKTTPKDKQPTEEPRALYKYNGTKLIKIGSVTISQNAEARLTQAQFTQLDNLYPGQFELIGI